MNTSAHELILQELKDVGRLRWTAGPIDVVAYHGTTVGNITRFNRASHFGTKRAASSGVFLVVPGKRKKGQKVFVYAVQMKMDKPIRLKDGEANDLANLRRSMLDGDYPELLPFLDDSFTVLNLIELAGFDGVVYRNKLEDNGRDSYIPLHSPRILEVIER